MSTIEIIKTIIGSSIGTTILFSIVMLISKTWIVERVKLSLQKEHSEFTEELQWESKVREQAEKVAEYISLVRNLKENSKEDDYIKANRLSWELAMWLPEDIYKEMVNAIIDPSADTNILSVIISVRKLLLQEKAGNLSQDNVAHHAPGIGKK